MACTRTSPWLRWRASPPAGRTCIPLIPEANLKEGDIFRYRPLGCPITHFARVLKSDRGVVTVHLVGPVHLLKGLPAPEDIGLAMVLAFEGTISRGKRPEVGETVRFLPEHCMMQKVHSGVVVHSEGNRVRIEGIDLEGVVAGKMSVYFLIT